MFLPASLRPVHRDVRTGHEFIAGRCSHVGGDHGDPDAGPDQHRIAAELKRAPPSPSCSRSATADGSPPSSRRTANSSPPSRASVSPGRRAPRHRSATRISRSSPTPCPEAVVDQLEVVEIAEQDRELPQITAVKVKRVIQPVGEQRPVRQARQLVVERLPGDRGDQLVVVPQDQQLTHERQRT